MGRLAVRTGIRLAGGDVTSGPLSICVTALGLVDEVIEPARTRAKLIAGLRVLENKRDTNPPRKHGNIPL